MLDWAPAEGMRTIKGQFVEIVGTEISIMEILAGQPRTPYAEINDGLLKLDSLSALVDKLTQTRAETLSFVNSLDDAGLSRNAGMPEGFAKYLQLEEVPVSEMLRYLVRHESYHVGQLFSYLWASGNNPYNWE
jgi:uncharacterized damage-inducible protein DinB